jgi:pimeloyl-ACP methyl ester carboxylesterase
MELRTMVSSLLLATVLAACPEGSRGEVDGITVAAGTTTLESQDSVTLSATVRGSGSFNAGVDWSLVPGAPGGLSVTSGGTTTYTAPLVSSDIGVTVVATAQGDRSKIAPVTFIVKAPTISGITASATRTNVSSGESVTLEANLQGSGPFDPRLRWTIVTGGGTLSSESGASVEYTTPTVSADTTAAVRVSSSVNPNRSSILQFTVSPGSGNTAITGIIASAAQTTVMSGSSTELNAKVSGNGPFDSGVVWSLLTGTGSLSSDRGTSVTYTAPTVTADSPVTLRASAQGDPQQFVTVNLTVVPKPAIRLALSPATATLKSNGTLRLRAAVAESNSPNLTWRVVSGGGTITPTDAVGSSADYTAPSVRSDATAVIEVSSVDDPSKTALSTVTLAAPKLSLQVQWLDFRYLDAEGYAQSENTVSVPLGGVFRAVAQLEGTTVTQPVSFSSSDPNSLAIHSTDGQAVALLGGIKPNASATLSASVDGYTTTLTVNVGEVQNLKPNTMFPFWSGASVVRSDGVYGLGAASALGIGQMSGDIDPPIKLPTVGTVLGGSGGYNHNLVVTSTGRVLGTGGPQNGTGSDQLGWVDLGLTNIAVTAGHYQTNYFILNEPQRRVFSYGANYKGQACRGNVTQGLTPYGDTGGSGATRVIAGREFAMLITKTGQLWACGSNVHGELGRGGTGDPVSGWVPALRAPAVIDCTGDDGIVACITPSRQLVVWGRQPFGQFGLGHASAVDPPTVVPTLGGVLEVACNYELCAVRTWDGEVWVAGKVEGMAQPAPINANWAKLGLVGRVTQIALSEYKKLFVRTADDRVLWVNHDKARGFDFAPVLVGVTLSSGGLTLDINGSSDITASPTGTSFSKIGFWSENPTVASVNPVYVQGHHDSATRIFGQAPGSTRICAQSALGGTTTCIPVTVRGDEPPQIRRFSVTPSGALKFDQSFNFGLEIWDPEGRALTCKINAVDGTYSSGNWQSCNDGWSPGHKVTWTSGEREFKLEVSDGRNVASSSLRVSLQSNNPPSIASFSASPASGAAPLGVTLLWSASDPDGDFVTCQLDANGDGVVDFTNPCSNFTSQRFSYSSNGTYNARLRVTDIRGGVTEAVRSISVGTAVNVAPVVSNFTATLAGSGTPESVTFAWSARDPDGDALGCSLDADGNGTTDHTTTVCGNGSYTHRYPSLSRQYDAMLTISDGRGGVTRATRTVIVGGLPSSEPKKPLLLAIHGIGALARQCTTFSDGFKNHFETRGFEVKTVGFYADENPRCDFQLDDASLVFPGERERGERSRYAGDLAFGLNTDIRHLAYRFAWLIDKLNREGYSRVYVVGHSMGGLIARFALGESRVRSNGVSDFPNHRLGVEALVTIGTPGFGSNRVAELLCPIPERRDRLQCRQVSPDPSPEGVLQAVYEADGWNRQAGLRRLLIATHVAANYDFVTYLLELSRSWFGAAFGGFLMDQEYSDGVVPAYSAMHGDGGMRVLLTQPRLAHAGVGSQTDDNSANRDATLYCSTGGSFGEYDRAPHVTALAYSFITNAVGACGDLGQFKRDMGP